MWWEDEIMLPFVFSNSIAEVLRSDNNSLEAWMSSNSIDKILSYSRWQSRVKFKEFVPIPLGGLNDIFDACGALG